jgi:hypothetical protein
VVSFAQYFYDVVVIAERIEQWIRAGTVLKPAKKKGYTGKKRDVEVNNVEEGYKGKWNYQTQSYQTPSSQISNINFDNPFSVNQPTNLPEN